MFQILNIQIMALDLPCNDKMVALALAAHYNGPNSKSKLICPGVNRLSLMTGMSYRSVERSLKNLITMKMIRVSRRFNNSSQYHFLNGINELPKWIAKAKLAEVDEVEDYNPAIIATTPANEATHSRQVGNLFASSYSHPDIPSSNLPVISDDDKPPF